MPVRLTPRHLVARSAELAELEQAFELAAAGHPQVVLLAGESGVGKTRLINELGQRLCERSAQVLWGEAVGHGEAELPYAPLTGALRPLVRSGEGVLSGLSAGSRTQLAALLPGLQAAAGADERQAGTAQLRLFEALLEALELIGEAAPLTLVLEDVHWADPSTRTFISFLARSLRKERILLLLSFRSDELHRRHPLRPLLSELDRLELTRRIELRPFDPPALAEALEDILGQAPEPSVVARFHARTEGNPLYLEELLAAGEDGRGAAPQSLRDAFTLRIERLGESAQRAVRALAVAGAADEAMLAEVSGIPPPALTDALRAAVAEQVLVARPDGALAFRHALLQETVYEDLLPGERVELHLTLARALEAWIAVAPERRLELSVGVAHHYGAAGDQPAALRAAVQAALLACAAHAYAETADQAERALELWPRVSDAETTLPLDHVELITLAAEAHRQVADYPRAEVLLRRALDELDEEGEPLRIGVLLARLARVQWSLNHGPAAVASAEQALALLPQRRWRSGSGWRGGYRG